MVLKDDLLCDYKVICAYSTVSARSSILMLDDISSIAVGVLNSCSLSFPSKQDLVNVHV
jgi:hypothetical protein